MKFLNLLTSLFETPKVWHRVFWIFLLGFFTAAQSIPSHMAEVRDVDKVNWAVFALFLFCTVILKGDKSFKVYFRIFIGFLGGALLHEIVFRGAAGGSIFFLLVQSVLDVFFLSYAFTGMNSSEEWKNWFQSLDKKQPAPTTPNEEPTGD